MDHLDAGVGFLLVGDAVDRDVRRRLDIQRNLRRFKSPVRRVFERGVGDSLIGRAGADVAVQVARGVLDDRRVLNEGRACRCVVGERPQVVVNREADREGFGFQQGSCVGVLNRLPVVVVVRREGVPVEAKEVKAVLFVLPDRRLGELLAFGPGVVQACTRTIADWVADVRGRGRADGHVVDEWDRTIVGVTVVVVVDVVSDGIARIEHAGGDGVLDARA